MVEPYDIVKYKDVIKEWLHALLEALILLFIMYLVFWPLRVDGSSMEATFRTGERVVMCRMLAKAGFYNRGDVVVCSAQLDGEYKNIIKRVVAVSGDRLIIEDGIVSVNGKALDEDYIQGYTSGNMDLILDEGCIFVLGDNRQNSTDSRSIGPIQRTDVKGRVFLRIWPLSKIELF